jgi:hypothetical protein
MSLTGCHSLGDSAHDPYSMWGMQGKAGGNAFYERAHLGHTFVKTVEFHKTGFPDQINNYPWSEKPLQY